MKTRLIILLTLVLMIAVGCCSAKPVPITNLPKIRLRNPPKEKQFTPPPQKIESGQVKVLVKIKELDDEGNIIKESVEPVTIDAKGQILLEEKTFNNITDELLQRRAWDKYAKSTIDQINEINKPKPQNNF